MVQQAGLSYACSKALISAIAYSSYTDRSKPKTVDAGWENIGKLLVAWSVLSKAGCKYLLQANLRSTPMSSTFVREDLVMKIFLRPFFLCH